MICPHEEDIQQIMEGVRKKKNQSYVNILNECLFTLIACLPNSFSYRSRLNPTLAHIQMI